MINQTLKALYSGYYDVQKMRVQAGNRIVANFKSRLGIAPSTKEEKSDKEAQEILQRIRIAYDSMADAAAALPGIRRFVANEVISQYAELVLADTYVKLLEQEDRMIKNIKQIIHREQLWNEYLKDVLGVGELMALVLLANLDIHIARYPSSFWAYCGLDVANDGRARSQRSEHLVIREYIDGNGEKKTRQGLTYNPKLRSKLLGVLGPGFLRAKNEKYSSLYDNYKHRLESHPVYMDGGSAPKISKNGNKFPSAKQHRHQMAIRYIVKIFLIDLHVAWRQMEGLPLSQPYHVAKLGMRDHCQTGQENHRLSAYQHPLENNLQKVGQCFRANHSSAACQIPIENQSVKAVYDQGKGTNGAENLIKP